MPGPGALLEMHLAALPHTYVERVDCALTITLGLGTQT
jgi:hypothetical protein